MTRLLKLLCTFMLVFLCIAPIFAEAQRCSRRDYTHLKKKIRTMIRRSPEQARWSARLLRIGFHDCLVGKCDGSIQFELSREENVRLDIVVDFLKLAIKGTCSSLADAIKIGMELSMELSRGPTLKCPLGTKDATRASRPGQIGQATDDFNTLIKTFTRKRFSVLEAIAANYGGHSLGGFNANPGLPFTPTPDRFNNNFCKFIIKPKGKSGFNALPSDEELVSKANTKRILARFARDGPLLRNVFGQFMRKLCRM